LLALLGLIGVLVTPVTGTPIALAQTAHPSVLPVQALTALLGRHAVYTAPRANARGTRMLAERRPLTGERTVLPVIGRATDAIGHRWLRVRLPGRPNGSTGWIKRATTAQRTTRMHIVVETSHRRVVIYRSGRVVRRFAAIVGKPATPTPVGEFFVEESIALPATAVGAPFALALSARSDVFQEFDGGPGQIALHGLANVGGSLGTAASHGCVRLSADAMTWLVERMGPGTPVSIR
jgi:lipoprotein-anchoring transpeptidase ErfK/SrfK